MSQPIPIELRHRTEDIPGDEILRLFVPTDEDRTIINLIKAQNPVILEGSRGTGKSFLLRVAEQELLNEFEKLRIFPVYITFLKGSLLHTDDPNQFHHWMLATICSRVLREVRKRGLIPPLMESISILGGFSPTDRPKIEEISKAYEDSYKKHDTQIDPTLIPDPQVFKDAIEDLCRNLGIVRFCFLFDEVAHIFRPEQQRQFFTLFRDLRSPYISCNAAVYPGVTSFGPTFQLAHDATLCAINRDVFKPSYLESMKEIVIRQADEYLLTAIKHNQNNFNVLAYASNGNPRFLIKTVDKCRRMNSKEVDEELKRFYRSEIWSEHSGLAERYPGYSVLVDWGRDFIEQIVIPETQVKNEKRVQTGKDESTCYFWIHRDAPEIVKKALMLLAYTGIVYKGDDGIRATRADLGTRYSLNLGCLFSFDANPINSGLAIARYLSIKRFTEFGANFPSFQVIQKAAGTLMEPDMNEILNKQLAKTINVLDITTRQIELLNGAGIHFIGDILNSSEDDLDKVPYIGQVRARRLINAATTAMLEYLAG
jgi:hypothetical protein